jgi:dienelactone hydrolase
MPRSIVVAAALGAAMLAAAPTAPAQEAAPDTRTDAWLSQPVDDATFRTYLDFFTYNPNLPFNVRTGEVVTEDGVTREHVTFQSTSGMHVTAYIYRPASRSVASRGGVVYLHGGSRRGKDAFPQVKTAMALDGWTILAFDLLHYGERGTGVLTTYSNQEKAERLYNEPATYLAFVEQTAKDASRGYDVLVRELGLDQDRILLMGHSRGGVLSSIVGAVDTRFAGVVLMHPGHFGLGVQSHRAAACPANYIGRISPRPVIMFQTTADSYFLPESTIRPLVALAREPVDVHWGDGPHGFMSESDMATLLAWMRDVGN